MIQEAEIWTIWFEVSLRQIETLSLTHHMTQKGLAEWVKQQECLLSKREALGSSLSAVEKIEKSKD
jgi:hypothetical protein